MLARKTLLFIIPVLLFIPLLFAKDTYAQPCGNITCGIVGTECVVVDINCSNGGTYTDGMCEHDLDCLANDGSTLTPNCICPYGSTPLHWPSLYGALGQGHRFGTGSTIGDIVSVLLGYIFPIAGLLMLLYLLYGGFQFLTSAGNPQKAQAAKGAITMAIVGFIIIFAAYWITQLLGRILGLSDIGSIF